MGWCEMAASEGPCSVPWLSWDVCSGRMQLPCLTTSRLSRHRDHTGCCDWQSQLCPVFQLPYQDAKHVNKAVVDPGSKPIHQLSSPKWMTFVNEMKTRRTVHLDLTYVVRAIWLDGCCWKPLSFGAVCCYTTIVTAILQSGRCVRSDASSPLLVVRKTVIKNSGWLWGRATCHDDSSSVTVKSQIEIKFQPIRLRVKKIQPGRLCGGGRCREPVNESLNSLLAWLNWPHSLIST